MTYYRRGKQRARLTETHVEVPCLTRGRPSYRWVRRLALLDPDTGEWLYSEHWRCNATKKSRAEIEALGYVMEPNNDLHRIPG